MPGPSSPSEGCRRSVMLSRARGISAINVYSEDGPMFIY